MRGLNFFFLFNKKFDIYNKMGDLNSKYFNEEN